MKHKQNSVKKNEILDSELVAEWEKIVIKILGGEVNQAAEHIIVVSKMCMGFVERGAHEQIIKYIVDTINLMWDKDETDKNRFSVGWNSALAELLARLEVKSTAKRE